MNIAASAQLKIKVASDVPFDLEGKASIERGWFPQWIHSNRVLGMVLPNPFYDIGTRERFDLATQKIKKKSGDIGPVLWSYVAFIMVKTKHRTVWRPRYQHRSIHLHLSVLHLQLS